MPALKTVYVKNNIQTNYSLPAALDPENGTATVTNITVKGGPYPWMTWEPNDVSATIYFNNPP